MADNIFFVATINAMFLFGMFEIASRAVVPWA